MIQLPQSMQRHSTATSFSILLLQRIGKHRTGWLDVCDNASGMLRARIYSACIPVYRSDLLPKGNLVAFHKADQLPELARCFPRWTADRYLTRITKAQSF